jgi:PAS domain S-box-containing protein
MPIRLKLILPTLLIVGLGSIAAAASAAAGANQRVLAALGVAAVALLALQLAVHERWVIAALRGLRAMLGDDAPAAVPALHGREWRELQGRIAALLGDARSQRSAIEQAHEGARRAEEALRISEQRYVLAVRGAQDGVWEHDLRDGSVWLSPRWKHMLGIEHADDRIALDAWRERLHPDDRDGALQALQAHLECRCERYEHQHRVRHRDGRWRWLLSRGAAIRRANGTPYRIVGLDTDITRVKRVEEVIDAIAQGTAGLSGERFFRALVRQFARALCVDCAFITECADRPATRARTLAFWRGDGFDANHEYELAGTPCERVLREGKTYFQPSGLARLFPRECGCESYLGVPILGRDGGVIGHLAFVDSTPMDDDMLLESVYRIFTARAAVELELEHALGRAAALERKESPRGGDGAVGSESEPGAAKPIEGRSRQPRH